LPLGREFTRDRDHAEASNPRTTLIGRLEAIRAADCGCRRLKNKGDALEDAGLEEDGWQSLKRF